MSGPPPGYWQASDGNWYPPQDAALTPTPTPPRRSRWKLWAGIGAGVLVILIIIGLVSPKKKAAPAAVPDITTEAPTSARPATTTTTRPPKTTTTRPPATTTTTEPATTTTAPPTTVSASAALFTWYNTLGKPVIAQVGNATDAITAAAKSFNVSALATACQQLTTASQRALDLPAPPNASMAGHFSAAMSAYHSAGQDCYRGATQIDAAAIGQATSEITDGNSEISLATADVKAVSGG